MNNETDVFIVGTGLSGLYAALLLSKMGVSIHMIEKENNGDEYDELLLLSPRILQLLDKLRVLEKIIEKGTKHRSLDLYYSGELMGALNVFDNDNVGIEYSLSVERSVVYRALLEHLEKLGISFPEENEELMKIEEHGDHKLVYLKNNQVWKSQIVLVENDDTNIVRQALGIAYTHYYFKEGARYFYTLEVPIVDTNFPSAKEMCIIKRDEYALYTLGHHDRMYITFEHRPSWTKINLNDEIPIPVALDYIKYVLEPYHIEFGKVESYVRWKGEQRKSELFEYDHTYFFIGPSSQLSSPRGFMDLTVYLEEVQNLCWKLAFHFRQCATPCLLDTFQLEIQKKSKETVQAAGLWLHRLMMESNPSIWGTVYQLNKLSRCFVGDLPYDLNEVNRPSDTLISESDQEEPSFEFTPPQPPQGRQLSTAGHLAPDSSLTSYSLLKSNGEQCEKREMIRPNYPSLNDHIQSFNPQGICFTLLVFCEPLASSQFIQDLAHTFDMTLISVLFITNSTRQEAVEFSKNFPFSLDRILLDHDQQCYQTYDINSPEVVVIRPDGYIGTRIPLDYNLLCLYFDSFLSLQRE